MLLNIIRAKQVHVFARFKKLKGDVRNDQAKAQGLNANLLVSVFALGIEESQNVRVVDVQVDSSGTLTLTKLIGVRESVL